MLFLSQNIVANAVPIELKRLMQSYPSEIKSVTDKKIIWQDNSQFHVENHSNLFKHFFTAKPVDQISLKDLQCDSYENVFKKMYGATPQAVQKHLTTMYWMPGIFGNKYPIRVTTVNGVDKKLASISQKLEKLSPKYYKYLENLGGAFYWRTVKNERYLSAHSFGIALDLNTKYGDYWLWDFKKTKAKTFSLKVNNRLPQVIVDIFEQAGFLWGGRWAFYDTMHFEYRPELFKQANNTMIYNHELGERCLI